MCTNRDCNICNPKKPEPRWYARVYDAQDKYLGEFEILKHINVWDIIYRDYPTAKYYIKS
jgi:hypothetical protein